METTLTVLDKVNSPADLRELNIDEMNELSHEMRELIIKKVNTTGGHFGPNLGIVEMTVAMHKVFNSPVDKFVFDVHTNVIRTKFLQVEKKDLLTLINI